MRARVRPPITASSRISIGPANSSTRVVSGSSTPTATSTTTRHDARQRRGRQEGRGVGVEGVDAVPDGDADVGDPLLVEADRAHRRQVGRRLVADLGAEAAARPLGAHLGGVHRAGPRDEQQAHGDQRRCLSPQVAPVEEHAVDHPGQQQQPRHHGERPDRAEGDRGEQPEPGRRVLGEQSAGPHAATVTVRRPAAGGRASSSPRRARPGPGRSSRRRRCRAARTGCR